MKIVKVTYTTTAVFAETNQKNIKVVMKDLQKANYRGINYNACLCTDQKTFIHTAFFDSDEDQKLLGELPAFRYFQEQLKVSGLEAAPRSEQLILIGSSVNIFN